MATNILIGVGGSGQHVVHAYLRMLTLTNSAAINIPTIYIIDADAELDSGNKNDSLLCSQIQKLHEYLIRPIAPERRPHFSLIRPFFQEDVETVPVSARASLELADCSNNLVDAFMTDDDDRFAEFNDRNIPLLQGMYANAKVGATAFAFKIMRVTQDDSSTRTYAKVNFGGTRKELSFDLLSDLKGARVAIVGSSFGGTGSGVIPALVRFLTKQSGNEPAAVRAFMTLPWFELESSNANTSAAATAANGIDPKARNAALGLRTYLDELDSGMPNGNYVVAQFPGVNAKRIDDGNYNQHEHPHAFNLVLATSIQHFMLSATDIGAVEGNSKKRKLYSLVTAQHGEEQGIFDAEKSAHLRFRVKANDNRTLADIVKDAELLALALEKGAKYILPGETKFKLINAEKREEPEGLSQLCKNISTEYEKKALKQKGIWPKKETAPEEIYAQLADALLIVAYKLRHSLLWMDKHQMTQADPIGVKLPSAKHLFDETTSEDGKKILAAVDEQRLSQYWGNYGAIIHNKQTGKILPDSTPATARAFSLFVNIFFNNVDFPRELKQRMESEKGSPVFAVAAQMLTDFVFQEVQKARESVRLTVHLQDTRDEAKPDSGVATNVFLRDVMAKPKVEDARLCVINKATLGARIGNESDNPGQITPLSDNHPLSLRQLDPYIGVSEIDDLSSGERLWPESALMGIPNVLAPKLIQKWRLQQRAWGMQHPTPLASADMRNIRLSEYGLYQHARRVVEAAFWLLFTRDERVELKTFAKEEMLNRSTFAKLLNAEYRQNMGNSDLMALPQKAIVLTGLGGGDYTANKVLFVNDPECGWFLAANSEARRFFAQIYGDLPSVRYGESALDLRWANSRGKTGGQHNRPAIGSFDEKMVFSFCHYLHSTYQNLDFNDLLWAQAISDTYSELRTFITTSILQNFDEEEKPVFENVGIIDVLGADGKLKQLSVRSPKGLGQLTDIFIPSPIFFHSEEEDDAKWNGLWPVYGKAWEMIDIDEISPEPIQIAWLRRHDKETHSRSVWKLKSITLPLKNFGVKEFQSGPGWDKVPGSRIGETDIFPWTVAIWPNFITSDWQHYLAVGLGPRATVEMLDFDLMLNKFKIPLLSLKFIFYGEFFQGGEFGEIGIVEKSIPIKLKGLPKAVELRVGDRVLGSFPVYLRKLHKRNDQAPCSLGLDFGTSNTCLAYKTSSNDKPYHLALLPGESLMKNEILPDLTKIYTQESCHRDTGVTNGNETELPDNFFYQSFNVPDEQGRSRSIPSELFWLGYKDRELKSMQLDYHRQNQERLVKEFGIADEPDMLLQPSIRQYAMVTPFMTPVPPNPGVVARDGGVIRRDFLRNMEQNFKSKTPNRKKGENFALRTLYLEQILMTASASMRIMDIRNIERFVATIPGAFEEEYKNTYARHLTVLAKHVFGRAGIKFSKQDNLIELATETAAALSHVAADSENVSITIDMGGGTTDIGIIIPDDDGGCLFSYMASLPYAGNDLMSAWLRVKGNKELLSTGELEDDEALESLKIAVRIGRVFTSSENGKPVAIAFFEALFEYVLTLLASINNDGKLQKAIKEKRIKMFLIGNGFNLTKVFFNIEAKDFFSKIIDEAATKKLLPKNIKDRIVIMPNKGDTKLSLIQGALQFDPNIPEAQQSKAASLLIKVSQQEHGRVAIWYPCIKGRKTGADKHQLGTEQERLQAAKGDSEMIKKLKLSLTDRASLEKSFPITCKYWDETDALDKIFVHMPQTRIASLGHYYLCGAENIAESSFSSVILARLAENPPLPPTDLESM